MKTIDYDDEDNIENYGNRASFTKFIVPEDADVSVIEVSWAEALEYATDEMTDDDMESLGLLDND